MSNFKVKIMVGKEIDYQDEMGSREYKFSVGKKNSKIPFDVLLNILEDGMRKEIFDKFGVMIKK